MQGAALQRKTCFMLQRMLALSSSELFVIYNL